MGHTINGGSCDANGTFGAGHSRVCDLVTKTLASTPVHPLQDVRDGRFGFGEVSMGVVRSAVSFLTMWLIRQLSFVHKSTLASLFQVSDTRDRFTLQPQPATGSYSLVSNWNHSAVNGVINISDRWRH